MRISAILGCLAFVLTLQVQAAARAQTAVDLELVLAVDVSRSMDVDELRVQRDGYIAAFRHPEVLAAVRSGPFGKIAVTYVEWAGPETQATIVPWTLIDGEASAEAFAARLSTTELGRYTGTSISGGLLFAAAAFGGSGFTSDRKVIDISGDGPNNRGVPVEPIRSTIVNSGITINGLPIVVKAAFGPYSIPNLDVYYEDCVIGGPGAFLIPVHEMSQLAQAIRRKLVLEIAAIARPMLIAASPAAPRIDCMIGEKLIERWLEK